MRPTQVGGALATRNVWLQATMASAAQEDHSGGTHRTTAHGASRRRPAAVAALGSLTEAEGNPVAACRIYVSMSSAGRPDNAGSVPRPQPGLRSAVVIACSAALAWPTPSGPKTPSPSRKARTRSFTVSARLIGQVVTGLRDQFRLDIWNQLSCTSYRGNRVEERLLLTDEHKGRTSYTAQFLVLARDGKNSSCRSEMSLAPAQTESTTCR